MVDCLRATLGLCVLACIPLWAQATDTIEQSPYAVVEEATQDLLAVIRRGQDYFDEDPDRFYVEVASTLDPLVDFERFSRSVMAVYARKASPEQRHRFAETFKWGLVRTYAKALLSFDNEDIRVLPPDGKSRRRPDRASVKMEVVSNSGNVYPIEYSMVLYEDGKWRLRNVIIDGINLGLVYRDQFAEAMNDRQNHGDIDLVIDSWSVIAKVDAGTKGEEQ
jgi:phospholipid transport system substrate-binding protein